MSRAPASAAFASGTPFAASTNRAASAPCGSAMKGTLAPSATRRMTARTPAAGTLHSSAMRVEGSNEGSVMPLRKQKKTHKKIGKIKKVEGWPHQASAWPARTLILPDLTILLFHPLHLGR
jgi:hypothetical protein